MGRAILIVIMGAGIIFAMSSTNRQVTIKEGVDNASSNFEVSHARNIAKAGVEISIMQLDSNRNYRTGFDGKSLSGGALTTKLSTVDLEHVRIISTGLYSGKTFTINCVVRIPPTDVPTAFNYALAADGPLNMNGTVDVIREDPSQMYNASIHSNHSISTGTQVRVEGFGTSAGSITCNPLSKLPDVFEPPYNPGGSPEYSANTPKISIPDFDPDKYKAIADEVYEGDVTISGNDVIGDVSDPKIIWIGGNLTLSGTVDLSGSGIYVVKGQITVNGNVSINNGVGEKSNLGFYSAQSVTINGNPSVEGQFYAKDNFVVNGNATITGNVIVKNSDIVVTSLNGSAMIRFRRANPLLTSPIWTTNPRPNLVSYWE